MFGAVGVVGMVVVFGAVGVVGTVMVFGAVGVVGMVVVVEEGGVVGAAVVVVEGATVVVGSVGVVVDTIVGVVGGASEGVAEGVAFALEVDGVEVVETLVVEGVVTTRSIVLVGESLLLSVVGDVVVSGVTEEEVPKDDAVYLTSMSPCPMNKGKMPNYHKASNLVAFNASGSMVMHLYISHTHM